MADATISSLSALTGSGVDTANDVLPIVDNSAATTKKITVAELATGLVTPLTSPIAAALAGYANTWTAAQTHNNSQLKLLGSSTGATTFTSANSSATNYTITFPAADATMATLGANTYTGLQNANLGLNVAGANFTSRGITDSSTAKALTLSGSGANSVTIANSATNPVLSASAGALSLPLVADINGGQLAGLRNKIINGNFDVWQRGTTAVTTANTYTADRWLQDITGDTISTTQGAFVSGDALYDPTAGNTPASYYIQLAVTSVANTNNYAALFQRIEDVKVLAGKTVTVSFWAKAAAGTPLISVGNRQNFGTGGSPSSVVDGTATQVALSTSWTKYTVPITFGSLNGKTLGTTAYTSYTQLAFWLDAGASVTAANGIGQATKTVSIAQVQLEIGSVATPFEQRFYGMELALCQRYYYRVFPNAANALLGGSAMCSSTTVAYSSTQFPVTMRIKPTALEQSGTAAHYAVQVQAAQVVCSSVPVWIANYSTTDVALTTFTFASGLTAGNAAMPCTANATTGGYLGWSAEL